ncbi:MAG: FAD-binding protein [Deltaproteobacteria bacterium]|nr:FAD-binding protein [Deltaproteobacteria bacterium]MBW2154403.1 FAD-binding protein [Deltaproteobacteria bacterium]
MQVLKTDVVIIGAGAAGIRAALAASAKGADVVVISKAPVGMGGSTFSGITRGWGIQGLVGNERTDKNLKRFYDEIMQTGLGRCDPELVRILVEESGPRIEDLISFGLRFQKEDCGSYRRVRGCFSECRRAFMTEDFKNVKKTFRSMLNASSAKFIHGTVLELMVSDNQCLGAFVFRAPETLILVKAKATVLATGGAAAIFGDHLVEEGHIGEGYRLAHKAGARLENLEFIQFMLGVKSRGTPRMLPLGELRNGGVFLDNRGGDVLKRHIPDSELRMRSIDARLKHFPFSSRDVSGLIDIAIATERAQGGRVYWHSRKSNQPGEVFHFAHAQNGGVKIDDKAESTVSGLFAAGEVAAGPHGADRLGGCMMTATQVFGARAGHAAACHARRKTRNIEIQKIPESIRMAERFNKQREKTEPIDELIGDIRKTASAKLMILRKERGIKSCLNEIQSAEAQLEKMADQAPLSALKAKTVLAVMTMIATAALNRKQSLGSHYRCDGPHPTAAV